MSLTIDEVRHIASLARLALTDEEAERLREQLSGILDHFELLKQLDTSGVQPTAHSLPLTNVMRDDETWNSLTPDKVLANAPRAEGDYVRVRAVFDGGAHLPDDPGVAAPARLARSVLRRPDQGGAGAVQRRSRQRSRPSSRGRLN